MKIGEINVSSKDNSQTIYHLQVKKKNKRNKKKTDKQTNKKNEKMKK